MPLLREVKDQLGSSYLLDHADNPVEWRTWGDDALEEAARLDRPIFLSVGYAACHWCHVMAHESFEDPDIARLLNEYFVPVKVDREERPDVDALYMAATQLVAGHGGWPMSVFLLCDGRPFMAGTYYPPSDRSGQVGFPRLLNAIHGAWMEQREVIERQAAELSSALAREVHFVDHLAPFHETLDLSAVRRHLRDELVAQVDAVGGFGPAPKFPRPSFVEALLEFDDETTRAAITRTLEAMSRGGLFDHFGGGFARYSVDDQWHVPHFEKMLSDQALLARCYLRASRVMVRPEWREVALATLGFVARDLGVGDGYASSLDADAGNVEGAHVTWTPSEVNDVLRDAGYAHVSVPVLTRWRIESPGAFEGRSIPRLSDGEPFTTPMALASAQGALTERRAARVQPARDEKIVLEWNAMMASAFLASDDERYSTLGVDLLHALGDSHFVGGVWWRTQHHQAHATASDVAWLADAMVDAFEFSGDAQWLTRSHELAHYLLDHYWDGPRPSAASPHQGGGVFSQSDLVRDLSTRPKEIFDGATPSAHALAARCLARVALCRGDHELLLGAQRLVELAGTILVSHPSAVPDLVAAAGFALGGVEVVIPGVQGELAHHVRSMAMPRTVMITGSGPLALLAQREEGLAYVCRAGACQLPVASVEALEGELRRALLA
ncbi:MAG TPA: thioredoxin domain-containing protein [Acidimicrobiales bacterium]|nr:thioredoxin domain-containing protein [Acidimicrobiales bacterium]